MQCHEKEVVGRERKVDSFGESHGAGRPVGGELRDCSKEVGLAVLRQVNAERLGREVTGGGCRCSSERRRKI